MRVGGKIHDYYDGALAYGRDESLYFDRETLEIKSKFPDELAALLKNKLGGSYWSDHFIIRTTYAKIGIIGFCGKLYPFIHLKTDEFPVIKLPVHDEYFFGNFDKLHELVFLDPKMQVVRDSLFEVSRFSRKNDYTRLLEAYNVLSEYASDEPFIRHNSPYFSITYGRYRDATMTLCPRLADFKFYKVKDPFTAFQEISMYLGGVIPRQVPEMINISDKDRIAQHGFDKLSFRHPFK